MNGLIAWWARNSVAANLLMFGIMVSGLLSYFAMERELDPKVNFNGITIAANWPGASPQEIEEQVISRIEESLSDLDSIDYIRSFSGENSGNVWMRAFETVDFTQFQNEVKQRVDAISTFPVDMEPLQIQRWTNDFPYMRLALSGDIGEKNLKHLADAMRKEVLALDYVSLVTLFGTREEEVSIEVSPEALERYDITFADVATAIRQNSLNLTSGSIRTDAGETKLTTRALADSEDEIGDIVVRETADGGQVRVKDVATVVDGFEDNELLATVNGTPTVLINILNSETMQIEKAADEVRKWMEERRKTLPEGVTLRVWDDGSINFRSNLSLLLGSAGLGLLLVMIVLFLTLRPIVAIWVSIGIATAYLGAFIFLPSIGISINFISMFSFLLVLGIVVDDAIIVGENIHTECGRTGGGITGATLGAQLVAKPVVFGVMTTIIAFLPWIFITGNTSDFTRNITWVVVFALIFSLVEALLILPSHLSKMKPREHMGRLSSIQKSIADGIVTAAERYYRPVAEWGSNNRWTVTFAMIGIYAIFNTGILGAGYVGFQFDPDIEADEINIQVTMPDGTPYSRAEQILAQMQQAQALLTEEVAREQAAQGDSAVKLIDAWYTRARSDNLIAIVKLARPENRPIRADGSTYTAKEAALRLRDLIGDIPDAEEVTVDYQRNNPDPGIQFAIGHADLDTLREASNAVMAQLRTYETVFDVRDNLQGVSQEARFTLKPGAQKLGLTLADVSRQVRQGYFGEEPMRLPRGGEDVRIKVRYPKSLRQDLESIENFRVRTPTGEFVPLDSVAEITYAPGISAILHWDRKRATIISADLREDNAGDIFKDMDENFWPKWQEQFPGADRDPIGQARGQQRFFAELLSLYTVALLAMYALLAVAFKSYWQPLMIMVAIPFAYIGALIGHFVTGTPLTFFSFFGIAAAAGVVVNDNLVMVDYCNKLRERGMDARDAMVEAGVKRFRPIFLTTLTTVIGLLPMLLERSQEAAFLKPMVLALSFGVMFDFFVTLLLVPALYRAGGDISRVFGIVVRAVINAAIWVKNLYFPPHRDEANPAE